MCWVTPSLLKKYKMTHKKEFVCSFFFRFIFHHIGEVTNVSVILSGLKKGHVQTPLMILKSLLTSYDSKNFLISTPVSEDEKQNKQQLNNSLLNWINNERFGLFMKITHGNLPQVWKVKQPFSCVYYAYKYSL